MKSEKLKGPWSKIETNSFQFKRSDRVSQEIKDIVSAILTNIILLKDSGLITITKVKTSNNLRFSKIYISFIGNKIEPPELVNQMNQNINEYRYHLGKTLKLKYIPEIKFYHDNTLEEVEKINTLINKANNGR